MWMPINLIVLVALVSVTALGCGSGDVKVEQTPEQQTQTQRLEQVQNELMMPPEAKEALRRRAEAADTR